MEEIIPQPPLGRLVQFDERSREYPIRTLLAAEPKKLKSYTWRCKQVLDQRYDPKICKLFAPQKI